MREIKADEGLGSVWEASVWEASVWEAAGAGISCIPHAGTSDVLQGVLGIFSHGGRNVRDYQRWAQPQLSATFRASFVVRGGGADGRGRDARVRHLNLIESALLMCA